MIGNFPESAGQIADTYIVYSQFDRVDKNLNDIFRDKACSELAVDTFKAVLAAKRYDDAEMVLRKIASSPPVSKRIFHAERTTICGVNW